MAELYKDKRRFTRTISNDASGDDTVKVIVDTINTYSKSPFVQETVKRIKAKSPTRMDFLRNLFGVADKNVQYLADQPGHEVVYTPLKLIEMGKGDCKKFTVFIGAVLKAAGYDSVPKVVKYDPKKDWEHIYIISREGKGYTTLDPVNHHQFNKEVQYAKARLNFLDGTHSPIMDGNKLSVMGNIPFNTLPDFMRGTSDATSSFLDEVAKISGVGCYKQRSHFDANALRGLQEDYMSGANDENAIYGDEDAMGYSEIGKKKSGGKAKAKPKKAKEQKRAFRKKFFHKAAKFNPAFIPIRAAFLTLVKLGGALQKMKKLHINLAAKLAEAYADPNTAKPLNDIWNKFGGEEKVLKKAIVQAGKSSMKGDGAAEYQQLISGVEGPELAIPAVITAASPILLAVIKMMKQKGKIPAEQADAIETGVDLAENTAARVQDGSLTPESATALVQSKLMRESMTEDNGGNRATNAEISEAANASENFSKGDAKGSDASPAKSYVEQQQQQTTTDTNTQAPGDDQGTNATTRNASNVLETPTASTPGAKGMMLSIYSPTSWVRIALIVSIICGALHFSANITHTLTGIAISAMILTTINLFINKKTPHNGKKSKKERQR